MQAHIDRTRRAAFARALRCGLAAALSAGSLLAPARAQAPQSFGETLDVRVVNIEAVVVDKDGNRIAVVHQAEANPVKQ